jgi:GT2 family glycosyltransferase
MNLDKVAIGIKTFLREEMLFDTIAAVRARMPEAQLIIADDSYTADKFGQPKLSIYNSLIDEGHIIIPLPFDSGFGAKSNAIAAANTRPYLLIGSDDFDFNPIEVSEGIEKLIRVLDQNPDIHIASGRVRNNPYEFNLIDAGDTIIETRVNTGDESEPWYFADLTVNYSLIRREVFEKVGWDDDVKIGGGEHGAFFVDALRTGFTTVWVPGVNINEQDRQASYEYNMYRRRARSSERPCFDKRGIKKYVLGNGQVDYVALDRS